MRKPLVAGNWKMNGSRESIRVLLDGLKRGASAVNVAEMAVCAPFVYLRDVQEQLEDSPIAWGGQDVSSELSGAFTGEIATSMLLDFGCRYVIVGHSERRAYHGESDKDVANKFAAARAAGLIPILCVGETLEERQQGITESVVARQLDAVIGRVGGAALADGVIAYEPVWAIGTGMTATPEQAEEVHAYIRGRVADQDAGVASGLRILYGGSMKPSNAAELLSQPDIDGGLIGGAALKAEDFLGICTAAN